MKTQFLSFLLLAALLVAGCKSESNDDIKNTNAKELMKEWTNQKKQTFTVNASNGRKLTLKGGTIIDIPAGAFTKNGTPVTGDVSLEVYEVLKRSDIIFHGTNTNYKNGRILESDGFLYINATQNGTALDKVLKKNMKITLKSKYRDNSGNWTQLWKGTETAGGNEDQFAWDDLPDDAIVDDGTDDKPWQGERNWIWGELNETTNMVTFSINLGKLGWFNCDVFWSYDPMTTVTVKLTGFTGILASYQGYSGDTFVFFCGKKDNVIAQLYTPNGPTSVKSYDNSMPIGKVGKLIAFSIKDGKYYFAKTEEITITQDMEQTLDLKPSTKEEIQTFIESLDNFN